MRLRQAVLAARELDPVSSALAGELGLSEPFHDPGVGFFGLVNSVFAIGDCFLEVIAPVQEDTAAGRWLERHGGDGGYMVIFDLEDLEGARDRAQQAGVRVVWQADLPDISATHLHPADMRGAIVSVDRSQPYGSWRWGGPAWEGRIGSGAPGRLTGITVAVADPPGAAGAWANVLGLPVEEGAAGQPELALDGGAHVRFIAAADAPAEGIVEFALQLPPQLRGGRERVQVGGVTLALADLPDQPAGQG